MEYQAGTSSSSSNTNDQKQDLSFCVLWSPLPPITWLIPFIGHTGIGDSHGIASDFRGPYFVGDDGRMAFGAPTRALKMDIGSLPGGPERWDAAIREANDIYRERMHNICCDNCHSHVSNALNRMPIRAAVCGKWNMVRLCFEVFFRAKFLSWWAVAAQFGPFLVVVLIRTLVKKV